jgi:hypothetical protein
MKKPATIKLNSNWSVQFHNDFDTPVTIEFRGTIVHEGKIVANASLSAFESMGTTTSDYEIEAPQSVMDRFNSINDDENSAINKWYDFIREGERCSK